MELVELFDESFQPYKRKRNRNALVPKSFFLDQGGQFWVLPGGKCFHHSTRAPG